MAFRIIALNFIRAFQAILAIVTLSFSALVIKKVNDTRNLTDALLTEHPTLRAVGDQLIQVPGRINFLIFVSTWTILTVSYILLAPRQQRFPFLASVRAALVIEAITTFFSFSAFVASTTLAVEFLPICLASEATPTGLELLEVCPMSQLDALALSLAWLLWTTTTILTACTLWRQRRRSAKEQPQQQQQLVELGDTTPLVPIQTVEWSKSEMSPAQSDVLLPKKPAPIWFAIEIPPVLVPGAKLAVGRRHSVSIC